MRKVPELRFAGFAGEWEEKEFGKVIERKSKSSANNSLPRVEYEDIIPEIGKLNKDINSKSSIKKGIYFESDDVLFGKLRPYLKNYLNPQFEGIAVGDFWILNNKLGDNSFLFYYIQIPQFQYIANTSIGTKMPRSDWNLVSGSKFIYPSNNEQEKIGNLFRKIDDLIEIQEGKVSKMRDYKKSMLQKMFPKKGELVPEFRFYGFNGEWLPMFLKDLVYSEYKGKAMVDKLILGGATEYLDTERLNGGTPILVDNDPDTTYNDILILWDGSKAGSIYTNFEGILGSTLRGFKINDGNDSYFIYSFLKMNENLIENKYRTPNIPHVVKDFSKVFEIKVPSLEEQQKIGQFFKNLDTQIENEERLLESYKIMKKSLLQKMFV